MPGIMDSRAAEIFKRQQQLENERSTFDAHWREVAERVLPRQDDFQKPLRQEGQKRTEKIFDATALLALDRAASAIDSLISPATQQWHGLEPEDDRLLEDKATMVYCQDLTKLLFRRRYTPQANFASQAHECYVSLMAFGTLGMFVDDVLGVGQRYKSCALSELYISENSYGVIDYVHRKFPLSARAAVQKWQDKCPERVRKASEQDPFKKWEFIHCVRPNEEFNPRRRDWRGMPWVSYFVAVEGREFIDVGGYRMMPYLISRHVTAPRETYGRGPAMMVLPDIKMVNEMEKTIIRAAHKIVDPPLLLYGDGILSAFSTRPNAMNYGGVDEQGRQLVHPMKTGANLPIAIEMTEQKRKVINDAFYVTLFQILVQNPQMTATEALIRAQEKGQLLAPTIGRQQTEFAGPMISRELDIAWMSGKLPPMPRNLAKSGGFIKAKYTSPLARLRRAEDGVAIMRTVDFAERVGQVRPEVWDNIDVDLAFREMADINGAPAKLIAAVEQVKAIRDARVQKQQQAEQLAQAEQFSKTAKNMAGAADTMPGSQPAQPAVQQQGA